MKTHPILTLTLALLISNNAFAWVYTTYVCNDLRYTATNHPSGDECHIVKSENKQLPVRGCVLNAENDTLTLPVTTKRPKAVVIKCTQACERIPGAAEESCEDL